MASGSLARLFAWKRSRGDLDLLHALLLVLGVLAITGGDRAEALPGNPGPGDWGDAPEGALAYPSLGVVGLFPTCFGGPSAYVWHGNPGAAVDIYWGLNVDDELDGNAGFCPPPPYERDECWGPFDGDGGLVSPDTYTINAGLVVPCGQTPPVALGFTCQVLNLVPGGRFEANLVNNSGVTGFVNVLFDWDQDGRWGGQSSCPGGPAPEHAIVNLPVPPFYVGPLSGLAPGPIQIGPNSGFVWLRMTVSNQPVPLDWSGAELFDLGESEDYLVRIDELDEFGEYGDAPEGALAYPGVLGDFPTCVTIGPTGHVYHAPIDLVFFGPTLDYEFDGNANVCPPPAYDQDECNLGDGDAGILMPGPITLTGFGTPALCPTGPVGPALGGCLTARWGVDIDIFVTNFDPTADYLVNVLADWDADGKWTSAVQTCPSGAVAPEHVLVNFPVPSGFAGPLSALSPPDFTVGVPADGLSWFRFTVSDVAVPPGWDGSGTFGGGETEDYLFRIVEAAVDVGDPGLGAAGRGDLRLDSVLPNPTSSATTLRLSTGRAGPLAVRVYDAAGREIATLYDGWREAGAHAFVWHGEDTTGREVTPGVYFVRAEQGADAETAKVVVVR